MSSARRTRLTCPDPLPRTWRLTRTGVEARFVKASLSYVRAVEARWSEYGRLVEWSWPRVYADAAHCVYALVEVGSLDPDAAVALFALWPKELKLQNTKATRLDFFELDPTRRGGVQGTLAFAAFTRLSADFGRAAIVLGALDVDKARAWYLVRGGTLGVAGWKVPRGLTPIGFSGAKLTALVEDADAIEKT